MKIINAIVNIAMAVLLIVRAYQILNTGHTTEILLLCGIASVLAALTRLELR